MEDIDKLARELAEKWKNRTHEDCVKWENGTDGTFVGFLKTALASYANDYCNGLLFVLADIRQKTGVGDKPMLGELADAIVSNKMAYGDERAKVNEMEAEAENRKLIEANCEMVDLMQMTEAQNAVLREALKDCQEALCDFTPNGFVAVPTETAHFRINKIKNRVLAITPSDAADMARRKDGV